MEAVPNNLEGSHLEQNLVDEYIDRLQAPLVGLIPLERRRRFVSEVNSHLEALIEDFVQEGIDPQEAAAKAIAEHGAPGVVAEEFIATWFDRNAKGPIEKRFGRANCTAFGAFVLAQSVYLAILQLRIFEPNGAYYQLPLSPSQIRFFWPAPLPYPEPSAWFLLLVGYPLIAPLLVGWWVGRQVPSGAGRAVYQALLPLTLCTFAIGVCLLPVTEGIIFALVELVYWLPAGIGMAHLSSHLRRASQTLKTPEGAAK